MAKIKQALQAIPIALIRVYQLVISPVLGPRCRFYPTCSHYAIEAIRLHGILKGGLLAAKRIGKCHPGNAGGIDPVPGSQLEAETQQRQKETK